MTKLLIHLPQQWNSHPDWTGPACRNGVPQSGSRGDCQSQCLCKLWLCLGWRTCQRVFHICSWQHLSPLLVLPLSFWDTPPAAWPATMKPKKIKLQGVFCKNVALQSTRKSSSCSLHCGFSVRMSHYGHQMYYHSCTVLWMVSHWIHLKVKFGITVEALACNAAMTVLESKSVSESEMFMSSAMVSDIASRSLSAFSCVRTCQIFCFLVTRSNESHIEEGFILP